MLRKTSVLALCLVLVCLILPQLVWGQQVTAAITGIITDPSGAPISGAEITATDVDRGTVWTARTNEEGAYNLPRLPIGSYKVQVEARGFERAVRPATQLVLNQTARMDVQMVVGQMNQTVEVTSEAPLLQTDGTQLGTIIDAVTVSNLPLASRNYNQLTLLAPGAVTISPGTFTSATTTGFGSNGDTASRPYINGNHEQANNYVLDGIDNNQVSDNLLGYVPNADAIQEFNMITQNAPAEFGNFQGGIINVSLKSGTNQYHGTLFEFLRNDQLNANSWENNHTIVNGQAAPRNVMRWNQFGGTVGGPIKRDKLFFFADYQGLRYDIPASAQTTSVLTQAERNGDFSAMLQGGNNIQLKNPFANGAPFLNDQIPLPMESPIAQKLFSSKWYPLPNTTGANNGLSNNYTYSVGNNNHTDQGDIKVDYNMSNADRIFARYSRLYTNDPGTTTWTLGYDPVVTDDAHHGVLDWTHTIGSSIVNEVRFGINYIVPFNGFYPAADVGDLGQEIGIANGNLAGQGLLALNFGGGFLPGKGSPSSYGNNVTGAYQKFASTVGQAEDTVVITKGRHTIHAGFQVFRNRINAYYAGNNGNIGIANLTGVYTGTGETDLFLGLVNSFSGGPQTQATWGQRSSVYAGFVQDDFRIANNLTLNIGLRYENHTPWVEVNDRQAAFGLYSGQIYIAGQSCPYTNCRALYNNYNGLGNYQPRLGVAWTPSGLRGKTVVRAAYGTSEFLEGTGTNLRLPMNPPTYLPNFQNTNPATVTAGEQQPYPLSVGPTPPPASNEFQGAELRVWDPNMQPATIQQWSLTVQQQITPTMTLSASYVGQHGVHLTEPMAYGQKVWEGTNPDGTAITAPSPYLAGNPTLQNEAGLIVGTAPAGSQRYNALQATLQKRFSNGLQFQVAYTWSKCMSNNAGYYGTWSGNSQSYFSNEFWDNVYDGSREWGPCFFDQTQNLTAYAVYEVPFGKGRHYGNAAEPILNAIAGGWNIDPIVTMHTGFPMSPFTWADPSGTGGNPDPTRPDCALGAGNYTPQSVPGGIQWFNPDPNAFPVPSGRFGNCGNDALRGPGGKQLDLSLQKDFAIKEGMKLEFRTDFVNFTNTKMLAHPDLFVGGGFGMITATANTPRNIQFGLKLLF